jgi:acyl-CoA reductase-like NAD-dependent aldehyde dehydrogenase
VEAQPLGVVLILSPWNYPFTLLFSPLVAAVTAGNSVLLKPSELAPAVSAVAARVVREAFDSGHVILIEGGADTARSLVELDVDHIFFTGSESIGRQILAAAARHLTPVTLELGGKCPCFVCPDARLPVAARRIAWGKFLNAGQTCVAPDHVFIHRSVKDRFLELFQQSVRSFYGDDPRTSDDFGRIVNQAHFERLSRYLEQGRVLFGGEREPSERYMAPTVLVDPDPDAPVLTEEIFGPILPVLEYDDLDAALESQKARPKPLAVYLFSESRSTQKRFVAQTASGGVGINDVVNQIVPKELPFGGVGRSGMGQYHGKAGFECFTHYRSVLRRSTRLDPGFAYPPPRVPLGSLKRIYRWLYQI